MDDSTIDRDPGNDICAETAIPEQLGEFRIVRLMQSGPMGRIYEAIQERLNRRVVVKVLPSDRHTPRARTRFMREQQVLASLHQTHIVPIHTAGREGAIEYFVMPYIDGCSLSELVRHSLEFHSHYSHKSVPSIVSLIYSPIRREVVETTRTLARPKSRDEPKAREATGARHGGARLSRDYLQSVARVMAEAAAALQHAHDHGVFHRDVKPSNIMVELERESEMRQPREKCWVIDFGLAAFHRGAGRPASMRGEERGATRDAQASTVSFPESGEHEDEKFRTAIAGTLAYMAPEQFEGKVTERTDIWGLGVTLYELIALQRPFSIASGVDVEAWRRQIETLDPPRFPRSVPRDLEAICFKAIRKRPEDRYGSAGEFADDLRRWLRDEPVRARKSSVLRRVVLWAMRNRGWAAALAVALLAGVLTAVLSVRSATARERAAKRLLLIQELEQVRLRPHRTGWRHAALSLARDAARSERHPALRDAVAATLEGIDAGYVERLPDFAVSSLAFHRDGRLAMGGFGVMSEASAQPARVWDNSGRSRNSTRLGPGVVAFRPDGSPLLFAFAHGATFELWNLDADSLIRRFEWESAGDNEWRPTLVPDVEVPVVAIASDGTLVAACIEQAEGSGDSACVAIWDAESGEIVKQISERAYAVTFSPDAKLVAVGLASGRIEIWPVGGGAPTEIVPEPRTPAYSLAFGRDPFASASNSNLLLAAGGAGARLSIWSLDGPVIRALCHGSSFDVYSLAFSPDGTWLASGGYGVRLWDVASGRMLLETGTAPTYPLAFSRDGKELAYGLLPWFGAVPEVHIVSLEQGRGIQNLHGLAQPVNHTAFSFDGKLVAGLSHDWQLGIWRHETGELLRIFATPVGLSADNAAIAFDRDGRHIAFCTGTEAKLWAIDSGEELRAWQLPNGYVDHLSFHPSGRLLLFRRDLSDRACRVRDLFGPDPLAPLWETFEFSGRIYLAAVSRWADYVVVEGESGGDQARSIRAIDLVDGDVLWRSMLPEKKAAAARFAIDPMGRMLAFSLRDDGRTQLVEMPHGTFVDEIEREVYALGVDAEVILAQGPLDRVGQSRGVSFVRRRDGEVLVTLGERSGTLDFARLHPEGTHVAWGNGDGTVSICHIEEVRRQLATMGLGW